MALDPAEFAWLLAVPLNEVQSLRMPHGSTFGDSGPEKLRKLGSSSKEQKIFTVWVQTRAPENNESIDRALSSANYKQVSSENRKKFETTFRQFRDQVEALQKLSSRELVTFIDKVRSTQNLPSLTEEDMENYNTLSQEAAQALARTKRMLVAFSDVGKKFESSAQGTFAWLPAFEMLEAPLMAISSAEAQLRDTYDKARPMMGRIDLALPGNLSTTDIQQAQTAIENLRFAIISMDRAVAEMAHMVPKAGEEYIRLATIAAKSDIRENLPEYSRAAALALSALEDLLTAAKNLASVLVPPGYHILAVPAIGIAGAAINILAEEGAVALLVRDDETLAEALLRKKDRDNIAEDQPLQDPLSPQYPAQEGTGDSLWHLVIQDLRDVLIQEVPELRWISNIEILLESFLAKYREVDDLAQNAQVLSEEDIANLAVALRDTVYHCREYRPGEFVTFNGLENGRFVFGVSGENSLITIEENTLIIHYDHTQLLQTIRTYATRAGRNHPDNDRVDWNTLELLNNGDQIGNDRHWQARATVDGQANVEFELSAEFLARKLPDVPQPQAVENQAPQEEGE